ncbi:fat-body protein 1-like [Teleopsis dalmanni]|uniref:fat-body protein 1-like n=1 Tax=Teleopsis dalmanni TaxID=139649 RepID=UPI0018CFC79E|nr:fat-body protein 1-like [Teleopsis dalmanni]
MMKSLMFLTLLVGLTAAGVLSSSSRLGRVGLLPDYIINNMDIKRVQRVTNEELIRQKFILDIFQHVNQPLNNPEILDLAQGFVTDNNRYIQGIDEEMLNVIELDRQHRLLRKTDTFNIVEEQQLRQMIGLYRLFVRSIDWNVFQMNVAYARMNVNGVMFVNSLLMAIRDRADTQSLNIPSINEILPELYYKQELIRKAQNMDLSALESDTDTIKPNIMDVIGLGRRTKLMNKFSALNSLGYFDRSSMWMPWREMRMQMAMQRTPGQQPKTIMLSANKIVLQDQSNIADDSTAMLTEDVGLNGYMQELISELIIRISNQFNRVSLDRNVDELMQQRNEYIDSRRRQMSFEDNEEPNRANDDNDNRDIFMTSGVNNRYEFQQEPLDRSNIDTERMRYISRLPTADINDDRLLFIGRKRLLSGFNRMDKQSQEDDNDKYIQNSENARQNVVSAGIRDSITTEQQRVDRLNMNYDRFENMNSETERMRIVDRLPTVDINSDRLLPISNKRILNDLYTPYIRNLEGQRERFLSIVRDQVRDGRRTKNESNRMEQERIWDQRITENHRRGMNLQERDDDIPVHDQRLDNREQPDRVTNRRKVEVKSIDDEDDKAFLRTSQINNLPTRDINDERLLPISRRRFINMDDNVRENTQEGNTQDDLSNMRDKRIRDGRRVKDQTNQQIAENRRRGMNLQERDDDISVHDQRLDNREQLDRVTNRRKVEVKSIDDEDDKAFLRTSQINNLPTRDINDERLLPISRRRFINMDDTVRENTQERNTQDDLSNKRDKRIGNSRRVKDQINRGNLDHEQRIRDQLMDETRDNYEDQHLRTILRMRNIKDDMNNPISEDSYKNERYDVNEIRNRGNQLPTIDANNDRLLRLSRRRQMDYESLRGMENIGMDSQNDDQNQWIRDENHKNLNRNDWRSDERKTFQRFPRSAAMAGKNVNSQNVGEVLVHNLQQLMARLYMEYSALSSNNNLMITNIYKKLNAERMNNPRLADEQNERFALRLNEMRLETLINRSMIERINDIMERINQEIVPSLGVKQSDINIYEETKEVNSLVGDIFMGRLIKGLSVLDILREVMLQNIEINQGSTMARISLSDPAVQYLLQRVNQMIMDQQRTRQVENYRREDLEMAGVAINDVIVDKLCTYEEANDADLINLLNSKISLSKDRKQTMLVARQQRLNHKSFTVKVDVTSDRNQRVLMRTVLVPSMEDEQQRQNYIVLDTTVIDLIAGRNMIQRKSKDITWTARDTLPYTEMYQRVMMAIDGEIDMQPKTINSQKCRFPHRLLLPRGRVEGLPMQLVVILTPMEDDVPQSDDTICGLGLGNLKMERLPLGFPLDRPIDNLEEILSVSNLKVKNVLIYHDK